MSRQHGKRKPPARVPTRRAAAPPPPAPARASPGVSPVRKWGAIGAATVVAMLAVAALLVGLTGLARRAEGREADAGTVAVALTVGLLLLPVAFALLAFVSQHPRPAVATLRATSLAPLAVPAFLVARDPVAAAVAGLGAAGVVALRPEAGLSLRPRILAVVVITAYTAVLAYTLQGASLSVLPLVFAILPVADSMALRKRAQPATRRRA